LSELLNCINPHDLTFLDLLPQFPSIPDLDVTPSLHEISIAVRGLKNNKAYGPDDIPAEVLKHSGHTLLHRPDSTALLHVRGTHGSSHSSGRMLTSSLSTNAKGIMLTVVTAAAFP